MIIHIVFAIQPCIFCLSGQSHIDIIISGHKLTEGYFLSGKVGFGVFAKGDMIFAVKIERIAGYDTAAVIDRHFRLNCGEMFIAYNFKRLLSMFSTKELVTKFEESVM